MSDHAIIDRRGTAMVLAASGAHTILRTETVQRLWGGYGQIIRCHLAGGVHSSVIVKQVRWPRDAAQAGGPHSAASHARKVRSYAVESTWYRDFAPRCDPACRVPQGLAVPDPVVDPAREVTLVLEDLDAAGFAGRRRRVTWAEIESCLGWLAHFHACFMHVRPDGLWPTGTYWHLDTRPDELAALPEGPLKAAAARIDRQLSASRFQTLVHGDAKLANFCFADGGDAVAAVDFQYVGGGCGMKDLAYFIGSCLEEGEAERLESRLLARYFDHLQRALARTPSAVDFQAVEHDWRALYPVAWTDLYRFEQGWRPGPKGHHPYSERLAAQVVGRA